jgi:hypothetical protein
MMFLFVVEKEEGLQRYSPLLPISPLNSIVKDLSIPHSSLLLSSGVADLESKSIVIGIAAGNAIVIGEIAASGGFDTLSDDFNHPALIGLILLLATAVIALRQWNNSSSLKRIWM